MRNKTRLYYEAHITVQAQPGTEGFANFAEVCEKAEWKASVFGEDYVDGEAGQWFASWRGPKRKMTFKRVQAAVAALTEKGYVVTRWKVEETVADSKEGDKLEDFIK